MPGSLVNPQVLADRKPEAVVYDSAGMHLDQVIAVMEQAEKEGLTTAGYTREIRRSTAAHREQMDRLEALGIPYEHRSGCQLFSRGGSGAACGVYSARREPDSDPDPDGGTHPVPEREGIRALAAHQATMVIFLSVGQIRKLCEQLIPAYGENTPAAAVYKATWQDEKIVRATLGTLAAEVEAAGITKTALILVGGFLGSDHELSKLYDKTFTHGYRKGISEK